MKKSSFVAMLLGTVSGVLFALGMCMTLIAEWDSFKPGIVFGCIGICLLYTSIIIYGISVKRMKGVANYMVCL